MEEHDAVQAWVVATPGPETTTYPMSEAPRALADLAHGRFSGAAVLHN